jgi:thiamine kinase-like enzyme
VNDILSAAEAISRIPGLEVQSATYRAIAGGLMNRTFLVETEERKLVLRLDAGDIRLLRPNRAAEITILREAAAKGIAPEVVFADPDAGILVCEYLPGRTWNTSDLEEKGDLEAVAGLVHAVHALPKSGVAYDASGWAERYAAVIGQNEELHSFAMRCKKIVDSIPLPSDTRCCHNDVVAANILATPQLRLLDWEYAGDHDPYFDLASLAGYHDLADEQVGILVDAYSGTSGPESRERLDLQLRLFDVIQWLWLAVRQTMRPERGQEERLRQVAERIR